MSQNAADDIKQSMEGLVASAKKSLQSNKKKLQQTEQI